MNNGLQAKRTQTFSALGQTLCVAVYLNQVYKPGTARREQLVVDRLEMFADDIKSGLGKR